MFSIDLLKGKGLPKKTNLKRSALKLFPIVIPILAVTVFGSAYRQNQTALRVQQQVLRDHQKQLSTHADDVTEYNKVNMKIKGLEKCLNDISKAMSYRVQISKVLVELVQSLPGNIFVYEMTLDCTAIQEKTQHPDSGEVKQQLVVRRKLKLVLCGHNASQSDAAVQRYVNDLNQSPLLTHLFTEIKPSARQQGEVDGREAIYYEIECTLREQGK